MYGIAVDCMNVAERNATARARLKAHYDALGAGQDGEAWYEDPAYDDLIAHGCFENAGHVVEIGCGTGRFADRLLKDHLAAESVYYGLDLSPVMVGLTRDRLVPYAARCAVEQGDAVAGLALGDRTADRVVMAFVLDLLTVEEAQTVLAEARRVLVSDGLLCVASLDRGQALGPRLRSFGWSVIHRFAPLKWADADR